MQFIVLGDFNFLRINFRLMYSDATGHKFLATVKDCSFTQHVDFPTNILGNTLDLIFISEPNLEIEVGDLVWC